MQFSIFLKRVLLLDAASCLGMGAMLVLGTGPLSPLLGLDAGIVRGAGLALLPIGLFILWLGSRSAAPAMLVYAVVLGNVGWTIESLLLVASADHITPLGTIFVTGQAAAVASLALLEWVGLRRANPAAA